jgi:hypothetical protein
VTGIGLATLTTYPQHFSGYFFGLAKGSEQQAKVLQSNAFPMPGQIFPYLSTWQAFTTFLP